MAYENPYWYTTYSYEVQDWGAAADIDVELIGPPGLKGKVKEIQLNCTETFAGSTNTTLTIGSAAGGAQNVSLTIDAAGGDAFTAGDVYTVNCETATANSVGAPGNSVTVTSDDLAADTAFYLSFNGATGTLTAGIATVHVVVAWGKW